MSCVTSYCFVFVFCFVIFTLIPAINQSQIRITQTHRVGIESSRSGDEKVNVKEEIDNPSHAGNCPQQADGSKAKASPQHLQQPGKFRSRENSPIAHSPHNVQLTTLQPAKPKAPSSGSRQASPNYPAPESQIASTVGSLGPDAPQQLGAQYKNMPKGGEAPSSTPNFQIPQLKLTQVPTPYSEYPTGHPYLAPTTVHAPCYPPNAPQGAFGPQTGDPAFSSSHHLPLPPVPSFLHGSSHHAYNGLNHHHPHHHHYVTATSSAGHYSPTHTPRAGGTAVVTSCTEACLHVYLKRAVF